MKSKKKQLSSFMMIVLAIFISIFTILVVGYLSAFDYDKNFDISTFYISLCSIGITISGVVVAIFSLNVAEDSLKTAKEISANQTWENLIISYRSTEFGEAVKAITLFKFLCTKFRISVKDGYSFIYEKKYPLETEFRGKNIHQKTAQKLEKYYGSLKNIHTQRRLISQYYWQLCIFLNQNPNASNLIKGFFSSQEIYLIELICEMDIAAANLGLTLDISNNNEKKLKKPEISNEDSHKNLVKKFLIIFGEVRKQ